jgi:hypothetical protein
MERITGYWVTQVIGTVALLGVADRLARGARLSDDVAGEVNAHPDSLYRLMRGGVSAGILQEVSPHVRAESHGRAPPLGCARIHAPHGHCPERARNPEEGSHFAQAMGASC